MPDRISIFHWVGSIGNTAKACQECLTAVLDRFWVIALVEAHKTHARTSTASQWFDDLLRKLFDLGRVLSLDHHVADPALLPAPLQRLAHFRSAADQKQRAIGYLF